MLTADAVRLYAKHVGGPALETHTKYYFSPVRFVLSCLRKNIRILNDWTEDNGGSMSSAVLGSDAVRAGPSCV